MRYPISNPSRFTPTPDRCGNVQLVRDKATLRREIVERLGTGFKTKSRLVIELQTSLKLINEALAQLELDDQIESFTTRSSRGRLDTLWCLPGQSPRAKAPGFNAAGILAAFQAAAALRIGRA